MPVPVRIVDSHTGGEPTRVVVSGGPDLGTGPLLGRLERFRQEHDRFRSAIVNEPRGSDVIIGALLVPPHDPSCRFGVIFFNNIGTIWMCGHGTIGLVATLAFLGWVEPGDIRIDTAVGPVTATLHPDGSVTIANVPSYRHAKQVGLEVPGHGLVHGDIAWGGNWFFLVSDHGLDLTLQNIPQLTQASLNIREAVHAAGYAEVDHIELFAPPHNPSNHSRNFVLCPGGEYDRSPCGTGTSAKLACLAADQKVFPDQPWRQESILGSVFEGTYETTENGIIPTITGQAFITAESTLILDPADPFQMGIS
jgi:4-hydroxyproline epimerase